MSDTISVFFNLCLHTLSSKVAAGSTAVAGIFVNTPAQLSRIAIRVILASLAAKLPGVQFVRTATRTRCGLGQVVADREWFASTVVGVDDPAPFTCGAVTARLANGPTISSCLELTHSATIVVRDFHWDGWW